MGKETISTEEAVKMIAGCEANRLPIVLEVLEQSGYRFSGEAVRLANYIGTGHEGRYGWDRTPFVVEKRREKEHKGWLETENEAALALRKAYLDGLRFSRIAELSGVSRKQPYVYMYGRVTPGTTLTNRLLNAIEECYKEQNIEKTK